MFKRFLESGSYPQYLYEEADGEGGSGGGGGGSDDGDGGDGGDDGDDSKDRDTDRKMIDMDDIKGKKTDDDPDGDDDDKKDDDKKDDDKKVAERPEDIPEKFWDAEKGEVRIDALNKSYKELEAKLGDKKAPDEYKIELSDDAKKLFNEDGADEDPLLKWFKGYAKDNNFSQEMFNGALDGFSKEAAEFMSANDPAPIDPKVEIEKLGKNGQAIVNNHVEFLTGMFTRGEFNEGQMQEILILTETAAGVEALGKLREHYGEMQNIPLNLGDTGGVKSSEELQAMQANDKYGVDAEYTEKVDKAYEAKYGTNPAGQSQASPL